MNYKEEEWVLFHKRNCFLHIEMLNTNFKNNNITDVLKVLNQIQEEGWICGLEEISAEMQKRFQLFTITGKEGRPQELHNTTINYLLDLLQLTIIGRSHVQVFQLEK